MNLVNAYINTVNITKPYTTWLTKKKGTNCGIFILVYISLDYPLVFILTIRRFKVMYMLY